MKQCKECGSDVSTKADACPKCGARLKGRPIGCGGAIIILFVIGVITTMCTQINNSRTSSPSSVYTVDNNQTTTTKVSISIPEEQIAFTQAIQSIKPEYAAAPNELKKSAIRTKRGNLIKSALNESLKVTNWVGKLTRMETNRDGKAIIYIKLEGTDIQVQTWNNALSDIGDQTMIPQDSNIYATVAEMSVGHQVVFSGTFIGSDRDYVKESSLKEENSMLEPEFIFKFDSIREYKAESTNSKKIIAPDPKLADRIRGVIKSSNYEGNNFLKLTVLSSKDGQNIFVWCSSDRTKIYKTKKEVNWDSLTVDSKIKASGNWIDQEGEKLLWASRIDLLEK